MEFKKMQELSAVELNSKKREVDLKIKELLSNSALTSMEKPHLKKEYKKTIAQINTLLNREKN